MRINSLLNLQQKESELEIATLVVLRIVIEAWFLAIFIFHKLSSNALISIFCVFENKSELCYIFENRCEQGAFLMETCNELASIKVD